MLGGGWMAGRQRDAAALPLRVGGRRLTAPIGLRRLPPHSAVPTDPLEWVGDPSLRAEVIDRGPARRVPVVIDDDETTELHAVVERLQSGANLNRVMAANPQQRDLAHRSL